MADQTIGTLETVKIGDLDTVADVYDDTLIPVEHSGNAKKMTGAQWKAFAVAAAQNVNKGDPGDTPYIGENGNWFIGKTDTGVQAAGKDGEDGADGKNGTNGTNGKDGADGVTPHIGDNGHWYIGTTDTGVSAQGPSGSGTGDMLASVYDPNGKAEDIFAYIDSAVAAGGKVFFATNGTTTASEIYSKVTNGYAVFCRYSNYLYALTSSTSSQAIFARLSGVNSTQLLRVSESTWSGQTATLQNYAYKTTTISNTSTDSYYPSAKAVYTFVTDSVEAAINDALEASY